MPQSDTRFRNVLLGKLSPADLALVSPDLELVGLELRQVLERARSPIEHVYFPECGYGSVVAQGPHGRRLEVGVTGFEGMTGTALVLGDDRPADETFVQGEGAAHRLTAAAFSGALEASPSLRGVLLTYVQAYLIQTSQTALANGAARIEERLARWILMVHDRSTSDELVLTHDFIALMLGVRRPGITVALHLLEGAGVIRSLRGAVRVLDREGLEEHANGSYGIAEHEYERLMGQPIKRAVSGS